MTGFIEVSHFMMTKKETEKATNCKLLFNERLKVFT